MAQSSPWCRLTNILQLSDKKCISESGAKETGKILEDNGFDVIPIDYWKVIEFGVSFHCTTIDLYKEGTRRDLFTEFDNEFIDEYVV